MPSSSRLQLYFITEKGEILYTALYISHRNRRLQPFIYAPFGVFVEVQRKKLYNLVMENFKKRKVLRLKGFDYSASGAYFITICIQNKIHCLSKIVGRGLAPAEIHLTEYGKIAEEQLLSLEKRYGNIHICEYVIMPNHIHFILTINKVAAGASPCPTVSDIICTYKSLTTRLCKQKGYNGNKLFQTSFYDHIIRDDEDYNTKAQYIDTNPLTWERDELYTER